MERGLQRQVPSTITPQITHVNHVTGRVRCCVQRQTSADTREAQSTRGLAIDAGRENLVNPDFQADFTNHAGKSYAQRARRSCLSLPLAVDHMLHFGHRLLTR